MRVARIGQISPDGVPITIPLAELKKGESFFLPCINLRAAQKEVRRKAEELNRKVFIRVRIEKDLIGIRVWVYD